jgi:hypothetical protein
MSPNNNPIKKVLFCTRADSHVVILGTQGTIDERRAHPRIATSAITRIEDQTHAILRAEADSISGYKQAKTDPAQLTHFADDPHVESWFEVSEAAMDKYYIGLLVNDLPVVRIDQ